MPSSQVPTVARTAENLSNLQAGSRAWFWFCPETSRVAVPLAR